MSVHTYDALGRLTSAKDPGGHSTIYKYAGAFGNLDTVVAPGSRRTVFLYDQYGRDSVRKIPAMAPRVTVYDILNRPRASWALQGGARVDSVSYVYDSLALTSVTDPRGQVHRFLRNALGWVIKEIGPGSADTVRYYYDGSGNPAATTNRRGQSVSVVYDALDRPLRKSGTNVVADSFVYAVDGRVDSAWNANARVTTYRSANGWVDSVATTVLPANQRFVARYAKDARSRLDSAWTTSGTSIAFQGRRYVYSTSTHELEHLRLGGRDLAIAYDAERMPEAFTLPTGMTHAQAATSIHRYSQNAFDRTPVQNALGAAYQLDGLGRIKLEYFPRLGNEYENEIRYDSLGRVTRRVGSVLQDPDCPPQETNVGYQPCTAARFPNDSSTYAWDAAHNLTAFSNSLGIADTMSYAASNRLVYAGRGGAAGLRMTYDADGNMIRRTDSTAAGQTTNARFFWSADGRLDSVSSAGRRIRYAYDPLGQLVRKDVNDTTASYFLWEGGQLVAELGASATTRVAEYAYYPGVDRPYALVTGSTTVDTVRYFHQDGRGNVVGLIAGDSGVTVAGYDERGQGAPSALAAVNRLGWKGLVFEGDSTRLYYVRARWYDAELGRFVSEDPIGIEGGVNAYAFGEGDPLNGFDPSGLKVEICDWVYPAVNAGDGWVRGPGFLRCREFDLGGGDFGASELGSGFDLVSWREGGMLGASNSLVPPCNDADHNRTRFFQQLPGIRSVARQLNVPDQFLIGLAAYESGWLNDHNYGLRNLWGLTRAGGRNLSFASFQAGNALFVRQIGPSIRGAQTLPGFLGALRRHGYNTVNPSYDATLTNVIRNVPKWMGACGVN